jgi:hypothetical protein
MISFGSPYPDAIGFFGSVVVGIIIIAAWVILAASRFVQGGIVERPERVPQLYGYTVCLITLLWALTSTIAIVDSSLMLSAPEYRGDHGFSGMEPSVSSFEAFRTTYDRSRRYMSVGPNEPKLDSLSEPELHRRYEALRADRIATNTVDAHRALVTNALSLLIAAILFVVHWRWLRRTVAAVTPSGTTRIDI